MTMVLKKNDKHSLTHYDTVKDKHLTVDSEIVGIRANTDMNCLLSNMYKVLNDWDLAMLNVILADYITVSYVDKFATKYKRNMFTTLAETQHSLRHNLVNLSHYSKYC